MAGMYLNLPRSDYSKIGLKSTTIASSFGKVFKAPAESRKQSFKQEDIAVSLLYLVSNNIGQIAYLNAKPHGIKRIYFSGFFIRGHPITMNTLSYAIDYWSKGTMKALFLRHEGYLGALGAFLKGCPLSAGTFKENFLISKRISGNSLSIFGAIETSDLIPFQLLTSKYDADSFILDTVESQTYWIDLLDNNLKTLITVGLENDINASEDIKETLKERLAQFSTLYRTHLRILKKEPKAYGRLTVRWFTILIKVFLI
jgi:type II pantothenate kinase